MQIHEIINSGYIPVVADPCGIIIAWNRSSTFQVYRELNGEYEVVDVATSYSVKTIHDAIDMATDMFEGYYEEMMYA